MVMPLDSLMSDVETNLVLVMAMAPDRDQAPTRMLAERNVAVVAYA